MRRKVKWIIIGIVIFLAVVVFINFIPTFRLKSIGMNKFTGAWVDVYYEKEKDAAVDVFFTADSEAQILTEKLGFTEKQDVAIYIYDNQKRMQSKKYGYIVNFLNLDWYIGDNIGTKVILTTPANPGKAHDYDTVRTAVLHEMVHAYVSVLNPDIRLWLTEGVALYLSNKEPFFKEYLEFRSIPSFEDIKSNYPLKFNKIGGYTFSHTYIEYLDKTYGWDKVLELIKTQDYEDVFGKSEKEIYDEWCEFIQNYYQ